MSPKPAKPATPPFSDSVGASFRRRRLELGLTLDQVAAETKIQLGYLKVIEGERWSGLPHSVQSLGFINRYAKLLKLDPKTASSKYLMERGPLPQARTRHKTKLASSIVATKLVSRLWWVMILVIVAGYLIWQLAILVTPPRLNLSVPPPGQTLFTTSVEVRGTTDPGAEVNVNGQQVYVDDSGDFSTIAVLTEGTNTIYVEAKNSRGKVTRLERSVLIKLPAD